MTHEDQRHAERGGPEMDDGLPDAAAIPVHDNPEDSFAPKLDGDLVDDGEPGGLFDRLPPGES